MKARKASKSRSLIELPGKKTLYYWKSQREATSSVTIQMRTSMNVLRLFPGKVEGWARRDWFVVEYHSVPYMLNAWRSKRRGQICLANWTAAEYQRDFANGDTH